MNKRKFNSLIKTKKKTNSMLSSLEHGVFDADFHQLVCDLLSPNKPRENPDEPHHRDLTGGRKYEDFHVLNETLKKCPIKVGETNRILSEEEREEVISRKKEQRKQSENDRKFAQQLAESDENIASDIIADEIKDEASLQLIAKYAEESRRVEKQLEERKEQERLSEEYAKKLEAEINSEDIVTRRGQASARAKRGAGSISGQASEKKSTAPAQKKKKKKKLTSQQKRLAFGGGSGSSNSQGGMKKEKA